MNRNHWILAALVLVVVAVLVAGRWLTASPAASAPVDAAASAGGPVPAPHPGQQLPPGDVAPAPLAGTDVPLPELPAASVDAAESMREAMEKGDPLAPPVVRDAPREQPTAAELADPRAYQEYEARQSQRLYNQYVRSANSEIPRLQADIERARAAGLPPEQIAEGEEKLRRIQAMRDQLQAEKGATGAP